MQLIWLSVFEYPKLIFTLSVMEEISVFVRHMLALQESSAMDWLTKGLSINLWKVKVFSIFRASKQPLRLAQAPIQTILRAKQLGQKAYHESLSNAIVKNVWSCVLCTSTPLHTITVWNLMKPGDNSTLYVVVSSQ